MYTVLPVLAKKAGMAPSREGVDFKPYLVCYRLSLLVSIPALSCLALGYGTKAGFGEAQGPPGEITVMDLDRVSLNYFEVSDGFVALNLTKGIVETLRLTNHSAEEAPRRSRFRDAGLRINREPFSDVPEPTEAPGALKLYRIAPVFAKWTACTTRYSISVACLQQNPVAGWAMSVTSSLCSDLYMVACRNPQPVLDPVYRCSSDSPVHGLNQTGPVTGLCGRVVQPPRDAVIDELSAVLLTEGWPQAALPNTTQVWLDVAPHNCIANSAACIAIWDLTGIFGIIFSVLTGLCILTPCALDCLVDRRIREARRFFEESEKPRARMVL